MKYVPALDGIRAIAVLFVLVAHSGASELLTNAGTVGVDLFFVLSGFLITSILLGEWRHTGRIELRTFYRRRVLRLWPALAVLLCLYTVAASLISTVPQVHLRAALAAALSYMNWYQAFAYGPGGFVGHAWSLSIEEQFYLVWPTLLVMLLWLGGRRAVPFTLAGLLLGAIAWRGYLTATGVLPIRIYAGSDTHADPLLIGCLSAALTLSPLAREWMAKAWALPVSAIVAMALILGPSPAWFMWEFTATGLLGAWLIVAATDPRNGLLVTALSCGPMVWVGRRSYGIYLWHVPITKFLNFSGLPPVSGAVVGGVMSLLVAAASYRFVETPFLRLKQVRDAAQVDLDDRV